MNNPLTWDDLANLYDQHNSGRRARTLPMETVWDWAESRTDLFKVNEEGNIFLLSEPNQS